MTVAPIVAVKLRMKINKTKAVLALAGRRIDAQNVPPRFPLNNVPIVRVRLKKAFIEAQAETLVSSVSCGVDIVGHEVANELEIRSHVVLPFHRNLFKQLSVDDRPGDWGIRFESILDRAIAQGELTSLDLEESNARAFELTNKVILDKAIEIAGDKNRVLAIVVWEGRSRGHGDITEHFLRLATSRKIIVKEIQTNYKVFI